MNTANALTAVRPISQPNDDVAQLRARVDELTERLDSLEMQLALHPALGSMTFFQYLRRRFSA